MTPPDPMTAFYAAVTAVENGQVGEVEVEARYVDPDESEMILTMTVRREVRHFVRSALDDDE